MRFYSGFSLKNEEHFFKDYIKNSEYTVCGFSYGAIKAFEDVKESMQQGRRVDTLQLFSPAFFQTKTDKFVRLQSLAFSKNPKSYMEQFVKGCFSPYNVKSLEYKKATLEQLNELLHFEWVPAAIMELVEKGLVIEVYLGSEDKIIDVDGARDFFTQVSTVTYIKNANHFLENN